ncbi:OmpA family protein [Noviherbaspirillum autotrophicum]|uniref:OmpA-like domain-containing protein n=1 Tax=Noviherbaspirillum autotrophicum TaxID=709839 RepID=A0A0C2BUA6_9BURK|nr:OmpA family protein [Noviherbaspirillum autotrophicum]KIF81626.1 hypothetical protein TSA66_13780 [Noviherbaspirillum autotrophicum]
MKTFLVSVLGLICATVSTTLLTASCSLPAFRFGAQQTMPALPRQPGHALRIAQLDFGRQASYGLCTDPACPRVTPKTMASSEPGWSVATKPAMLPSDHSTMPPAPASTPVVPAATSPSQGARLLLQFSSGASTLDAKARLALDRMLPAARQARKITIQGRTDNVGPTQANRTIALARALQVRDYLRRRMKNANAVIAIDAKGSCCFLSNNDTPQGRQANRRVEVVFTYQG